MKAIKTIVIILLVLAGVIGILGAMGEKTFRYERSVTIAAPAQAVWGHVNSLGAMDKWSPWNEKDPTMKKSLEGEDGKPGAVAKWEGNSDVGKGEHRLDSLMDGKGVRSHLTMFTPFGEMQSDIDVDLAAASDSTKVTWGMHGENGFMSRVMGMFMDMDAMIGKDFEKGLGYLKAQVEGDKEKMMAQKMAMVSKYDIQMGDRPAMLYAGVRKTVKWVDLGTFFMDNAASIGAAMGKAKVKPAGPWSGVYFKWDEVNMEADVLAGFPIAATDKGKLADMTEYETPAGGAYWMKFAGPYEGMKTAHEAMGAKLELDGKDLNANVVEEYLANPGTEKDSTKYETNIIYLAKAKAAL